MTKTAKFTFGAVPAMLSLMALTACEVTPAYDSNKLVVDSIPQGALVSFPDGSTCETPCPVLVTEPVQMTIARAGYKAEQRELLAGMTGTMTIIMELVAPTTEVEETALPEL